MTIKEKLNVNELRKELLGEEFSFSELDNIMIGAGYYSVFNDGVTDYIKDCKNVVYTALDTNICEIKIDFEIIIDNGEDEVSEAFYLKVLDISTL